MITKWFELPFFKSGRQHQIQTDIYDRFSHYDEEEDEVIGGDFLPEYSHLFRALTTPQGPAETKVVILGQDPYPTPGQANGWAFSVDPNVSPLPRSLQNIFKELVDDLNIPYPAHGSLHEWANQGVMLLNTCLTVSPMQAGSHLGMGWEDLTTEVLTELSENTEGRVFILWGKHAQSFAGLINTEKHHIIRSPHPSPLSAHYGFFGSKPFSRANTYLSQPIDWRITDGSGLSAVSQRSYFSH
jgi:uracil-DNA glycosylase